MSASETPGPAMRGEARTSVRSLTREEVPSVYQPIIDLASGEVFAHEAFVRCTAPAFASPIGLFERAVREGATGALGRTIRSAALEGSPPTPLFLNVHPHELREPWIGEPDDPIASHRHPIYLEITESATFDHHDLCASVLAPLCAKIGAHLVIDDLGAGYANLLRVLDLEPRAVKLDRTLITELDRSPTKRALVTSFVGLFEPLGAAVVAEGVETEGELSALRDCGVHFAQGYFLARPGAPPAPVRWPFG